MKRISIKAGPGSKIRVVRKGKREEKPEKIDTHRYGEAKRHLILSTNFLNIAEIRAESSFRPSQGDIEVIYALSGREHNTPDTFHKLSSRFVMKEASQSLIVANTEEIVNHILKERKEEPDVIVIVHTHPAGIAHLCEIDREYYPPIIKIIRKYLPAASIIVGIHSLSSEGIREREDPKKTSKNRIMWSSITRSHEIAFYDEKLMPVEVVLIE
jgi:proteasome lid subunit RPN8/RPN11